jgi:hypothetical protein
VVRRGLRLPGARPLACGIARWPAGFAGPGAPEAAVVLRGWRTPDYEALVTTEPAWPGPVGTRAVHVEVSRLGFAACRPALVTAGARTAA